jgi:lipoprotein signal peptidase
MTRRTYWIWGVFTLLLALIGVVTVLPLLLVTTNYAWWVVPLLIVVAGSISWVVVRLIEGRRIVD